MATYIKDLVEDNGDITRPVTEAGAVLLSGGGDLETALASKADQTAVDSKISIGDVQGTDLSANAKLAILNMIYPVGSIFMSATLSTPAQVASAIGGTWVAWGAGRVPVGVDASQAEFDTVEETGGEKTHKLTANELPNIHGEVAIRGYGDCAMWGGTSTASGVFSFTSDWSGGYVFNNTTGLFPAKSGITLNVGSDQAHNNLQPYVTCYMYKRTA